MKLALLVIVTSISKINLSPLAEEVFEFLANVLRNVKKDWSANV